MAEEAHLTKALAEDQEAMGHFWQGPVLRTSGCQVLGDFFLNMPNKTPITTPIYTEFEKIFGLIQSRHCKGDITSRVRTGSTNFSQGP